MYRLIASDLDETLIKADRTVCEENIEAIKKFMEMGGYFVCCTGRQIRNNWNHQGSPIKADSQSLDYYGSPHH